MSEENSDYFPTRHQLIGFYTRYRVCLLRGTDWIFNPLAPEFSITFYHTLYLKCEYYRSQKR